MGLVESVPRTHARETVAWHGLLVWKVASGSPLSQLHPSCHGESPNLSWGKPKQKPVPRVAASSYSPVISSPQAAAGLEIPARPLQ